ncbi:MAG TPA: hypothetical protein VHZ25_17875 [Acidobacteriaceae bacterium]|jgi:hypothetical protein|nr:hypothetical protein [Acidobacteriaceae bacterium]
MADVEKHRHAAQRGDIIRVLHEDYSSPMTSVGAIAGALDAMGSVVSSEAMQFHLVYLSDDSLIQIWRNRDMPTWRRDRENLGNPAQIRFAKLLPKGLHLLDGRIAEDPGVTF